MASILIVSFSTIASDPRVSRHVQALTGTHEVTTCGYGPAPPGIAEHVEIPRPERRLLARIGSLMKLQARLYDAYYWGQESVCHARTLLRAKSFDLILANDLSTLPLAISLAHGRPVLFDAHEYAPREFEDRLAWRIMLQHYYIHVCRSVLPLAGAMTTVCQGIADEYAREFGVCPVVLSNAAPFHDLLPRPTAAGKVRMIHHGNAMRSRRLENMIDLMADLDARFSLDFMLMPTDGAYLAELKGRTVRDPRIRFLPPIPMRGLVPFINAYDIGLYYLEPTSFNNLHALPNKFFEFIQARVALAIGPSPEMARIVAEHDCGVVASEFNVRSLARQLNALSSEEIDRLKQGACAAATMHCAERNDDLLRGLVDTMAAKGRS